MESTRPPAANDRGTLNPLALTCPDFAVELKRRYGLAQPVAIRLYRAIFENGTTDPIALDESRQAPGAAPTLARDMTFPSITISQRHDDGPVLKFISTLSDGKMIESVLIPSNGRSTLCVSSQVGCARACSFCVTGEMGLSRNLTPDEIVWQVWAARFLIKRRVDNIVFMGIGEPLDNFDSVIQAIRVISDQRGLNIACRHITVSTVGHVEGIRKLAALKLPNLRLAVSLNAPTDLQREQIMPINRLYPLSSLIQALKDYPLPKDGVIFIEYVLLAGVNDSREDASALARLLTGIPVRINVIPWNGGATRAAFSSPTDDETARFEHWLIEESLFVRIRRPRGRGVMAACGQLGRR